jgi:RHS repeat-associated protein
MEVCITNQTIFTQERETTPAATRHLHYISAGDGLAAVYVKNEGGADSLYYIMKDHLGSITGAINKETGKVYRQNFDAWGRKRNPQTWTYTDIPEYFPLSRGYTGHEHLDKFVLINMNGRMYDAALCRFLSPDPYVQVPDYSQNFNRYSYALNNPLVYTDPSGEFIIEALIIGALLNVGIQSLSGNIDNIWDVALAAGIGAAAGVAGVYLAGAACVSMGLAASGVTSGVIYGGTAGLAGGFITGAGNAWANGASFGDGIIGGMAAGGFGMMTGGVLGGIGGGISAVNQNRGLYNGVPNLTGRSEIPPVNMPTSKLNISKRSSRPIYTDASIEFGNVQPMNTITINDLNNRFANIMEGLERKQYVTGGNGPNSYDCSGAVCHGIRETANPNFGDYSADGLFINFSTTTKNYGRGSVIFYDWNSDGVMQHVVTKVSNTHMIHPSSGAGVIQKQPLNYLSPQGGKSYMRLIDWYKVLNIK